MKRMILMLVFVWLMMAFVGCGSPDSGIDAVTPTPEATSPPEPTVSSEVCERIEEALKFQFRDFGDSVDIQVIDSLGKATIQLTYPGASDTFKFLFADFVNAVCIAGKEALESNEVELDECVVMFSYGNDPNAKYLMWESEDLVSGMVIDTYGDQSKMYQNQTVDDLIGLYGAMNEFYELVPRDE